MKSSGKKLMATSVADSMKAVLFAVMMVFACTGMAQDLQDQGTELTPVETEQVNINHADAETIARVLSGIGKSRAEAIVSYREEFGDFRTLDELMMVRGVGEVTLRNNEARISFD